MKNVTKLACWPEFASLGFTPVKFRAHGKVVCIGAALKTENGEICIEPGYYSDGRSYHVSGPVLRPKYEAVKYINERLDGSKYTTEQVVLTDFINSHVTAREVAPLIRSMVN